MQSPIASSGPSPSMEAQGSLKAAVPATQQQLMPLRGGVIRQLHIHATATRKKTGAGTENPQRRRHKLFSFLAMLHNKDEGNYTATQIHD